MMAFKKTSVVLISLFLCCFTAAIEIDDENDQKYRASLENTELFGGDILLSKSVRFAIRNPNNRWPQRTIPYVIAQNRTDLRNPIEKAMRHIESETCIRFVERTYETDYVFIFKGEGCNSHVGRIGGKQSLSLGNGCEPFGTIVHELMHAIGFWHHHQRMDRDQYLNIYWQNIEKKHLHNFDKLTPWNSIIYTPFDFKSIMLYDSVAFSKDGHSKTMTAKNPEITLQSVWKKTFLSENDAYSINRLYNCV